MPARITAYRKFALSAGALLFLAACSEDMPIACSDQATTALVRRAFLDENRPKWRAAFGLGGMDYSNMDRKTPAVLAHQFATVQPGQLSVSELRTVTEGQGLSGKTAGPYKVCGATVAARTLGINEDVKVLIYLAAGDRKLRAELQDIN